MITIDFFMLDQSVNATITMRTYYWKIISKSGDIQVQHCKVTSKIITVFSQKGLWLLKWSINTYGGITQAVTIRRDTQIKGCRMLSITKKMCLLSSLAKH